MVENSGKVNIEKQTFGIHSEGLVFFWCLIIALIFWLLKALEDTYNYHIDYNLTYVNLPDDRVFTRLLPEVVRIDVRAPGWQLAGNWFTKQKSDILLDLAKTKGQKYIILSDQPALIGNQLPAQIEIKGFMPDTLFVAHEPKANVMLPIKSNLNIKTAETHGLKGPIVIRPDSTMASGPESLIEPLHHISTQKVMLENLRETTETSISLFSPFPDRILLDPANVKVTIPVERLTEKTLTKQVDILNEHPDFSIRLIPDKVTIIFQVPLSKYSEMTADAFDLSIDAREAYIDSVSQIPVKIESTPQYLYNIRIQPRLLDYYLTPKND